MKFPMINISDTNWEEDLDWYILFDLEQKSYNELVVTKHFFGKDFVDGQGMIYTVVGWKKKPKSWRSWLPNYCNMELVLKKTHRSMPFEEIKSSLLNRIKASKRYGKRESFLFWKKHIEAANTLEEIVW
ncbi:MAG: hypothetical protein OIF50_01405 [Flavobacteriaceae bacterium]|nr:hypothetical protein [Flavobacteriaceae bacterium]